MIVSTKCYGNQSQFQDVLLTDSRCWKPAKEYAGKPRRAQDVWVAGAEEIQKKGHQLYVKHFKTMRLHFESVSIVVSVKAPSSHHRTTQAVLCVDSRRNATVMYGVTALGIRDRQMLPLHFLHFLTQRSTLYLICKRFSQKITFLGKKEKRRVNHLLSKLFFDSVLSVPTWVTFFFQFEHHDGGLCDAVECFPWHRFRPLIH